MGLTITKAIESVQNQTYEDIKHIIVIDGQEYEDIVQEQVDISRYNKKQIILQVNKVNTGRNGFYGHRIYQHYMSTVKSGILVFLDADNWFLDNHIENCINTMNNLNVSCVYALRNICDKNDYVIVQDNCDSIGCWPRFMSINDNRIIRLAENFINSTNKYLIDRSCYAFTSDIANKYSECMNYGFGADSILASTLVKNEKMASTAVFSVNYRVTTKAMVDYFNFGNKIIRTYYQRNMFPWLKKGVVTKGERLHKPYER